MKTFFLANILVIACSMSAYSQRLENPIRVATPPTLESPVRLETPVNVVRPDFSGKWKLDLQRSRWPRENGPGDPKGFSWIMTIEQKLPAIFVTVKSQRGMGDDENFFGGRFTLYSDGRGDEFPPDGSINSSTTEWRGNKLVTTNYPSKTERVRVSSVQEWELLADRNTLVTVRKNCRKICDASTGLKGDEPVSEYLVFDRIK